MRTGINSCVQQDGLSNNRIEYGECVLCQSMAKYKLRRLTNNIKDCCYEEMLRENVFHTISGLQFLLILYNSFFFFCVLSLHQREMFEQSAILQSGTVISALRTKFAMRI